MKSPAMQSITRTISQMETEWRQAYEADLEIYETEREKFELRRSAWKDTYKANAKKGKAEPERPEDELDKPKLRRLVWNDATFESMHEGMKEYPAGIFVVRDELAGWFEQMSRSGREMERAFCLQAADGDKGFTVDRIGRGTIHVEACCMSMLGGIQPGRFRSYLVDAVKDGPGNDGLIQRLQLTAWPDTEPDFKYVDRTPNVKFKDLAASVFRKLVELDPGNPTRLCFAPDAQELFVDWYTKLQAKIRGDGLHDALKAHLSKFSKTMPAIALLFELADAAAGNGGGDSVSLEHARQAATWCDSYLESHARRVYSCVMTPQLRAARELAGKIKGRKVGAADGLFSCRDIYLKGWGGLDSPEAVKQAAEVLQDAGWVRDVSGGSGPSGGRPSNKYAINPGVWA
jgi:putative DNA primase/helicase